MNLSWMSFEDLQQLNAQIGTVIDACGPLVLAGLAPEIRLTDDRTIIQCVPILPNQAADVVLVEPMPEVEIDPVVAPTPAAKSAAKVAAPRKQITGSLTTSEKAEILRLDREGKSSGEIGALLNRKSQTVGLYLNAIARNAALAAVPARIAALEKEVRQSGEPVSAAVAVVDRKETAAPKEIPSGQPVSAAQDSPRVEAPAAEAAPDAGPDAVVQGTEPAATGAAEVGAAPHKLALMQADLTVPERHIFAHLTSLPRAMDWDLICDRDMCKAFARGDKLAEVALDFGKDGQWIKHRYGTVTATIRNDRGQITPDGQASLLKVFAVLVRAKKAEAA